jgi:hypothetical protein
MPSVPISARVSPYVHARLTERAAERNTSLAALVAVLLTAAVDDTTPDPRLDGPLVSAVRLALEDTDPADASAGVHRELCLLLARTVERQDPGYLAAITPLHRALTAAAPGRLDRAVNRTLADLLL